MRLETEVIFDIIIIGSGPIGLACALEAKQKGCNYLILEKGCLVNSLYHYPVNMTFFSTSERLEIGGIPFVTNNAKPTRNEALEYYRRVAVSASLNINLFEEVISVDQKVENLFSITTVKKTYQSKKIIVATGFYGLPFLLNIPGEDLPKVTHYYNDPHFYAFQKVVIVGANNSAVDAALETWRKGAEVTMVIREDQIGERVKYWVRPDIVNRIKEGSIKAFYKSHLIKIKEFEVEISTPEGNITIENDCVIAATGYQPDLHFLTSMGITLDSENSMKPLYNEETHESNVTGIYLAGVICGGMNTHSLFIENSREHAEMILNHIASNL